MKNSRVIGIDEKQRLYNGELFVIPANSVTIAIVENLKQLLIDNYKTNDLENLFNYGIDISGFEFLSKPRKILSDSEWKKKSEKLLESTFHLKGELAFDHMRLRANVPEQYKSEDAWKAYTAHRDTWYSNSQSQINLWMPLFDVTEDQTFDFYPTYFDKPIENTSVNFDIDIFMEKAGFQASSSSSKKLYPVVKDPSGLNKKPKLPFSLNAGDVLLFSASHLHQTKPNKTNNIRWSIDLRAVFLEDHKNGLGAINTDNASSGDVTKTYQKMVL